MDKTQLQTKRKEKQDLMERYRVEITALAGQIALLDEMIKDMEKETKPPEETLK